MIVLAILLQLSASVDRKGPDLVELASIVEPYERCAFAREPELVAVQQKLSAAWSQFDAKPSSEAAAARVKELDKEQIGLILSIRSGCGYKQTLQRLHDRLLGLHPTIDSARASWLADITFRELNLVNSELVRMRAGIPRVGPPAPGRAPRPARNVDAAN